MHQGPRTSSELINSSSTSSCIFIEIFKAIQFFELWTIFNQVSQFGMAKQLREFSRQSTQRRSADLNNSNLVIEEDLEDEFKEILSSIVNEDYIVSVTGIKDLSKVEYVSLQIDTKEQALYDLSEILPNLKHLVLDNSHIGSIRDLGTGMRLITSLSLSGCNLRDLDGIGVLIGLQELCLSDNLLSDISPLTLHENLEVF